MRLAALTCSSTSSNLEFNGPLSASASFSLLVFTPVFFEWARGLKKIHNSFAWVVFCFNISGLCVVFSYFGILGFRPTYVVFTF
jgi:hypothetical protein